MYVVMRRNAARSLNHHRTQSDGSSYHKPRPSRCLAKDNGAARCKCNSKQHYASSDARDTRAGEPGICNLLVCGDRFGLMLVRIVHLVETDTAVLLYCYTCRTIIANLQSSEKSGCESNFAIFMQLAKLRSLRLKATANR